MEVRIEKNTVQETLVIPLYGRKMCSELYPNLYRDETAVRLMERVDCDFSHLAAGAKSTMQRFGFLEVAMRQSDLAWEVRDYLRTHPRAAVVNLGCGLDGTGSACDNGTCRIYNIDFPDVIAVRNELLPAGEREENIACDLNDHAWMEKIDASGGAVFFAAGVFYYFLTPQVRALVQTMAAAFPGGKLVFDAACRGEADAENMDPQRGDSGRGGVFRRRGRCARDHAVGGEPARHEPRLYARLPEPARPVRQRLFPPARENRRRRDEDADRAH